MLCSWIVRLEDLGLIGNCQFSALIHRSGEIVWCCLPRFDSEPVFSSLLDCRDGGRFLAGPAGDELGSQRYLPNTNLLETTFHTPSGSFRLIDFAPRMIQHNRAFRPTQLYRILEPLDGTPRIKVVCEPKLGWSKAVPVAVTGSHHVSFDGFPSQLRLTTDIPLSYLGGQPFALTSRQHLALTWGDPIEEPLPALCERFWNETARYWQQWVKQCEIPPMFQREVIRSALVLKLHCFEDTGAIIASMTTSLPEAPGSGRAWDYRYCWLRDAYYVLGAFGLLGQFEEREQFVNYLLNVASGAPDLNLAPLYRVDATQELGERILENSAWLQWGRNRPGGQCRGRAGSIRRVWRDGSGFNSHLPGRTLQRGALARRAEASGRHGEKRHRSGRQTGCRDLGVPQSVGTADLFESYVLGGRRTHGQRRGAASSG